MIFPVVNSTKTIHAVHRPSTSPSFLAIAVLWPPSVLAVPVLLVRMISVLPLVMRTPCQILNVAGMSHRLVHLVLSRCDGLLERDIVELPGHVEQPNLAWVVDSLALIEEGGGEPRVERHDTLDLLHILV